MNLYPWTPRPYTNITPFTVRDGATYLQILEGLRHWLRAEVIPHIDENFSELVKGWEKNIEELTAAVDAQLDANIDEVNEIINTNNSEIDTKISDLITFVNDSVNSIINNSITVVDPMLSGIVNDSSSETRKSLNDLFNQAVTVKDNFTDAFNSAYNRNINRVIVPSGHKITLTETVEIPEFINDIEINGEVEVSGDFVAFQKMGEFGNTVSLSGGGLSTPAKGEVYINVPETQSLSPGQWLFFHSQNSLNLENGTGNRYGSIRQIRWIQGVDSIRIDRPLFRNFDYLPVYVPLNLGSKTLVHGTGSIFSSSQENHYSPFFLFRYCKDIIFTDNFTIKNGGGTGVSLEHCVNASITCTIDNLLDGPHDNPEVNPHFGYGVAVRGACREVYVGGKISRVRHAVTTVTGPFVAEATYRGEPENSVFEPITNSCTDKALDSHIPGWGLTYNLNDSGSGGGVHVRADNTTVDIISDSCRSSVLLIDENVKTKTTVKSLKASNVSTNVAVLYNSDINFLSQPEISFTSENSDRKEFETNNSAKIYGLNIDSTATINTDITFSEETELFNFKLSRNAIYKIDGRIPFTFTGSGGAVNVSGIVPNIARLRWSVNGEYLKFNPQNINLDKGYIDITGTINVSYNPGNFSISLTPDSGNDVTVESGSYFKVVRIQ